MSTNVDKTEEVQVVKPVTITLNKPITWEGIEYKELSLDFESLTGKDMIALEADFLALNQGRNHLPHFKHTNPAYQAVLAAKALGLHFNFMEKLSARDFRKVAGATEDFLLGLA